MKKGKLVLKVAVGLAAFGLLFTGCDNEDATAKKSGNAVEVTKPVESEEDIITVLTKSIEETTAFGKSAARSAAKDGQTAGTQLSAVQEELAKYIASNYMDIARLYLGMYSTALLPASDLTFDDLNINLADITPSDLLSTLYYYADGVDTNNVIVPESYEAFISNNNLTETQAFLEKYDDYVELSKLTVKFNGNYKASDKKLKLASTAAAGLRFNDIDGFARAAAAEFGQTVSDDVKLPLRYLSFSGDGDGKFGYTYGESKSLTGMSPSDMVEFITKAADSLDKLDFKAVAKQLVDEASLNGTGDLRFNLIDSEGQGGYFKIQPSVNGSLANYDDDIKLLLSVSDGSQTTFEKTYSLKEFTTAYGTKIEDLIKASIGCIPTTDELETLMISILNMIPGVHIDELF